MTNNEIALQVTKAIFSDITKLTLNPMTRLRIPTWNVDVFAGAVSSISEANSDLYQMPVVIYPWHHEEWWIKGTVIGSYKGYGPFTPKQYENLDFRYAGGGPELNKIIMRAKLAGWILDSVGDTSVQAS